MKTLIKNCHLISPDVDMENAAILINDTVIEGVFANSADLPEADEVVDAGGNYAFPGFIDIHTHGAGGYDVTDGKVEGIATIAKLKIQEGVTTFCPTTLTLPEDKLAEAMKTVAEYQATTEFAKIAGVHLEGPFVNCKCAGAQNPEYVRKPDIEEVKRLDAIAKVAIVSFAPDVEGGAEFATQLTDMGIVPSCGHSAATSEQMKKAKDNGAKHLTHFCNQMTPLHHRDIGMVGTGLLDDDFLIEMICDKIHLCPDMIQLAFKCKDSNKIAIITDAMCASWLEDGKYDLGGLEVYVANNAARLVSNDALAGSTLRYNNGLKNVSEVTGKPLKELVKATSYNQARSLGLENIGKLEKGYTADIAILNSDFAVESVYVDGTKKL